MELVSRILRNLLYLLYVKLLGVPYNAFKRLIGMENPPNWLEPVFKVTLVIIVLFTINELYVRVAYVLRKRRLEKDMVGHDVREPYTVRDSTFVEELDMTQHPLHMLQQLKKEKRYGRIAEIFSRLNQPEQAARWYIKDKHYKRAAEELAKAGKTTKAAKMLLRIGEYHSAANLFSSIQQPKRAAKALMKAGDLPRAACAYVEAGDPKSAYSCFHHYFTATSDPPQKQEEAADLCYRLLQKQDFTGHLRIQERNYLYKLVGKRFLDAGRFALAATLFQEGGDTRLASEIFKRIGNKPK